MVKKCNQNSTHSRVPGLGSVRTCWLGLIQVIEAVNGHALLARSRLCRAMTMLLE